MKVKRLDDTAFETIVDCFLSSFEHYYVKVPTDKSYYRTRWAMAKVDFALSYGMFDGEDLVGFIIHAIDYRNGQKIAHNTGTGVIPSYRGQRIVRSIYEFALPDLKQNGIEKCLLEVIVENSKAIKSYQSVGFEIRKTLNCFSGEIKLDLKEEFDLKAVDYADFDWECLPNQDMYSWDFNNRVIKDGAYNYYQIIKDNQVESYFVINPENKILAQSEILIRREGAWDRLFMGVKKISSNVRIINVDSRLVEKINFIKSLGLVNTVNQYEMKKTI